MSGDEEGETDGDRVSSGEEGGVGDGDVDDGDGEFDLEIMGCSYWAYLHFLEFDLK